MKRSSFILQSLLLCTVAVLSTQARTHATLNRSPLHSAKPRHMVVGYFGQWGVYDHFFVRNLVTSGAASELDQINYAQGFVTGGRCSVADPHADLDLLFPAQDAVTGRADDPATRFHGNFHQLAELKRLHPRLKILISLEGRASDFAADAQPQVRQAFVASCIETFLRGRFGRGEALAPIFDGIDLDWEYPREGDAENFIALLTEFRHQMDAVRPGLRLTIAVGPSPQMYPGVDMAAVSRLVNQIGIMNYDYNGPWNKTTGFLAPLYAHESQGGSVEGSILSYKAAGVPASKLLMGLPFYGYGWHAVGHSADGLFQPGQSIRGDRPYSYLQTLLAPATHPVLPASAPIEIPASREANHIPALAPTTAARTYVLHRDPRSHAPWLFDGDTFWTYEDPISIRYKADFAMEQQLGGVMLWELSEDSADAALLKAARNRFDHPDPTP